MITKILIRVHPYNSWRETSTPKTTSYPWEPISVILDLIKKRTDNYLSSVSYTERGLRFNFRSRIPITWCTREWPSTFLLPASLSEPHKFPYLVACFLSYFLQAPFPSLFPRLLLTIRGIARWNQVGFSPSQYLASTLAHNLLLATIPKYAYIECKRDNSLSRLKPGSEKERLLISI